MHKQLGLVLAASIAATASLAAAGTGSGAIPNCTAGMSTIGGKPARTFCGPAKATVHVGHRTIVFTGGSCVRSRKALTLQIGTVVLGARSQKTPYFGLDIGRYLGANPGTPAAPRDGTYTGGLVVVRSPRGGWDLNGADKGVKVHLKGNRTRGTFTGRTWFSPHTRVSGSFSCGR
jgi:hypothetical protein